jgi:hypothetical protein
MLTLLASIGIGGTLGVAIEVLADPLANSIIMFSIKGLKKLAKGHPLSPKEQKFIREYNKERMTMCPSSFLDMHY